MDNFNIKMVTPFFMVENILGSLDFYVDRLGFVMTKTWEPGGKLTWCWLEREGVSLMLQEYRADDKRYGVKKGVGVALCYQCVDALALYSEFLSKGLKPKEPFVGNGFWDVELVDPDGYHIHFESPTDVPEETTYSQWLDKKKPG